MSSMQSILIFLAFSASQAMKMNHRKAPSKAVLTGRYAELAGAFGGGGCFSAISQIGYLRGLMFTEVDKTADLAEQTQKMRTFGSSSGGSWGVGMATISAAKAGAFNRGKAEDGGEADVSLMGKWCMLQSLHKGTARSEWYREMSACAGCAGKKGGNCSEAELKTVFGAAANCIEKEAAVAMPEATEMHAMVADDVGVGRKAYLKGMEDWTYNQFFKNLGMPQDYKLKQLETPFQNGRTKWGIFWSTYKRDKLPPFYNHQFAAGGSGPIGPVGQTDQTLISAITKSGDAASAGLSMQVVQATLNMGGRCSFWTGILDKMTERKLAPYPFVPVPHDLRGILASIPKVAYMEYPWETDGLLLDNDAIGTTIQLMELAPEETRPATIVSAITGYLDNNVEFSVIHTIGYFKEKVAFGSLWSNYAANDTLLNNNVTDCHIGQKEVYNPTHFFSLDSPSLTSYKTQGIPKECTKKLYVSLEVSLKCWNMKFQAMNMGTIFIRDVLVVPNQAFNIKGGWEVSVYFSILSKNTKSVKWVADVFKDRPEEIERLRNFPILDNHMDQLSGLKDPRDAFALMNYNAFKGYMTMCFITFFNTQGQRSCSFCQRYPDDCRGWLPRLKFKKN